MLKPLVGQPPPPKMVGFKSQNWAAEKTIEQLKIERHTSGTSHLISCKECRYKIAVITTTLAPLYKNVEEKIVRLYTHHRTQKK